MSSVSFSTYTVDAGPTAGGVGYSVTVDGIEWIRQDFQPDTPGWLKMDQSAANTFAAQAVAAFEAAIVANATQG